MPSGTTGKVQPVDPGSEEHTASGQDVLRALFDEVVAELDAQKRDNKPYDPHLQALLESLYTTTSNLKGDLSTHEAIQKMWQNMPSTEIAKGEPTADYFFREAETFESMVDYYKAADSTQAASDLAQDWIETYRVNKELAGQEHHQQQPGEPGELRGASEPLKKLLGDHDLDMDPHQGEMTDVEYYEYKKKKQDAARRQAIWEGRTEHPKWYAELTPEQIVRVEKMRKMEEKKRTDREAKERKRLEEDLAREGTEIDKKDPKEVEAELRKRQEKARKERMEALEHRVKKDPPKKKHTKFWLHAL